jgi:polyhydroxybutyrate depolymerase
MPVLHLHGTSDPVIPYQGNNYYASVDQVINHWVGFNNTVTDPIIQSYNSAGMRIEHAVYDQGDRGVAVEHYKYIGGEHLWFETTVEGQNTASLIWNFLSQYDLKGRIEQ